VKDTKTFFMGNAQRPDRIKYPSAHNYYLDFLYNFGFLSIVPLICLIGFTVYTVYRRRKEISSSPAVLGLVIVVLFILFVDNFLKVGLRQPYPGIFSFFLWGLLLSKLIKMPTKKSNTNNGPDFLCHASARG
jgi:O-antigen ligase